MGTIPFFYDGQIRRYLLQIIRTFSCYQVQTIDGDGNPVLRRVPARYGDMSRMVASIIGQNSENAIQSAPFITVSIQNLSFAVDRVQDPMLVSKKRVIEREYDDTIGQYTEYQTGEVPTPGNMYSVERYMPVPYNLDIRVDIWTTNAEHKNQLFEQIGVVFNHGVQLQQNMNVMDWTSIFEIEQTGFDWSSRGIPQGVDSPLDIMTWNFKVPIWITPPARVCRQTLIKQIITNLHDSTEIEDFDNILFDPEQLYEPFDTFQSDSILGEQQVTTIKNHHLRVNEYTGPSISGVTNPVEVELLNAYGSPRSEDGTLLDIIGLTTGYGTYTPGESQLRLHLHPDIENDSMDIWGTLYDHPNNIHDESLNNRSELNKMILDIDVSMFPDTTLDNFNGIIDPTTVYPSDNEGERFITIGSLTSGEDEEPSMAEMTTSPVDWLGFQSNQNDIIEVINGEWEITFDSSTMFDVQYIQRDSDVLEHYMWTGSEWRHTFYGVFNPGYWHFRLDEIC